MTDSDSMDMEEPAATSIPLVGNAPLTREITFEADDEPFKVSSTQTPTPHRRAENRLLKSILKKSNSPSIIFVSTKEYEDRLKADLDRQLSGQPSELAGSILIGGDAVAEAVNHKATKKRYFWEDMDKKKQSEQRQTRSATRSSTTPRLILSQPKPPVLPVSNLAANLKAEDVESSPEQPEPKRRRLSLSLTESRE